MNTLDELNEELAKNQDLVYFALFYDKKTRNSSLRIGAMMP
jgi:hypothetical protein